MPVSQRFDIDALKLQSKVDRLIPFLDHFFTKQWVPKQEGGHPDADLFGWFVQPAYLDHFLTCHSCWLFMRCEGFSGRLLGFPVSSFHENFNCFALVLSLLCLLCLLRE